MPGFNRQCLEFINRSGLLKEDDKVLIAVSGGADSVALLLYFQETLKPRFHLSLAAAHLNHSLRGRDSDQDQRFVEALCQKLRIPLFAAKKRMKGKKGESPEETARRIRYDFLNRIAAQRGFGKVATAHHQDDQAETLLMRLMTGTGLAGASGIRPVNGNLIRPFLTVSRREIIQYLKEHHQKFRTDKSNRNTRFLRNKVRARLVPYLKKNFGPHVPQALSRFSLQIGEDAGLTFENAEKLLCPLIKEEKPGRLLLDLPRLAAYPRFMTKALLETAAKKLGHSLSLSKAHLDALSQRVLNGGQGGAIQLPGKIRIENSYGNLLMTTRAAAKADNRQVSFPKAPGDYAFPSAGLRVSIEVKDRLLQCQFPGDAEMTAFLDYESLSPTLVVRARQEGDRFHPLGAPGPMKLKEFLINRKVPKDARDALKVLCSGPSIAWVAGQRISECFKVRPETRKIAIIKVGK